MTRCWSLEPNARPQTEELDRYFRAYASPSSRIAGVALFDLRHQLHHDDYRRFGTTHGGMFETWAGIRRSSIGCVKVAIKVLRFTSETDEQDELLLAVQIWRDLSHANLLPVYGITTEFWPYCALVCPWFGVSLTTFLAFRFGDTLNLDKRINIIRQVATGLSYLHSKNIVHGDVNGGNVLIKDGIIRLTNFELMPLLLQSSAASKEPPAFFFVSGIRWADPELWAKSTIVSTTPLREHDVYALSSIMLQVLSGHLPYDYLWPTSANLPMTDLEQFKRLRPKRSPFIMKVHWDLLNDCWADDPLSRPTASGVLQRLLDQEEPLASFINRS